MDSQDFLKLLQGLGQKQLDSLAANIFAAFGIDSKDIKKMKAQQAFDAAQSKAPAKPKGFKAGGQTSLLNAQGKPRDFTKPAVAATRQPTISSATPPKPAAPVRTPNMRQSPGQLNLQGQVSNIFDEPSAPRSRLRPPAVRPKPQGQLRPAMYPSATPASAGVFQKPQGPYSELSSGRVQNPNSALNKLNKNVQQLTQQLKNAAKAQGGTMEIRGTKGTKFSKPIGGSGGVSGNLAGLAIGAIMDPIVSAIGKQGGNALGKNLSRELLRLEGILPGIQSEGDRLMTEYGYTPEDLLPRGNNLKMTASGEYIDATKQELVYGGVPKAKGQPTRMGESYGPPTPAAPQAAQPVTPVAPSLPPKNPNQQAPVTADPGRRIIPYPNLGIEQVNPYRSSMQMR
jgi:hypothetical protein